MFNYCELPDIMDLPSIRRCYIEFLFDYQHHTLSKKEKIVAFNQLLEILQRAPSGQVDDKVLDELSKFVSNNIDCDDIENIDAALTIIVSLKLKVAWYTIVKQKKTISDNRILAIVEECVEQYSTLFL